MKSCYAPSTSSVVFLLALLVVSVVALLAACGGGFDEGESASPADVPTPRRGARLGAGAGPTPVPVTPTPTATPSPNHLALYDGKWEGTYTIGDQTKSILLEFLPKELTGEGAARRRAEGTIDLDGVVMRLTFVRVDPETAEVSFRVTTVQKNFAGVLQGDKLTGTVVEGDVLTTKGTFETHAVPK